MKWIVAVFAALFVYAGYKNLRDGDDTREGRTKKKLPVPRRLLGVIQLTIGLILCGICIPLFNSGG